MFIAHLGQRDSTGLGQPWLRQRAAKRLILIEYVQRQGRPEIAQKRGCGVSDFLRFWLDSVDQPLGKPQVITDSLMTRKQHRDRIGLLIDALAGFGM